MRACRSVSYYALLTAFSSVHATHPDIHSFPTRRSSDLHPARYAERIEHHVDRRPVLEIRHVLVRNDPRHHTLVAMPPGRSEEHTSELQSLRQLVCRLLLEKKKLVLNCAS